MDKKELVEREKELRKMNLEDLERQAFKPHPLPFNFSPVEILKFAFVEKFGYEDGDLKNFLERYEEIKDHISSCSFCQSWFNFFNPTNSVLNGEDEKRSQVLITVVDEKKS